MGFWGWPLGNDDQVEQAARAALAIRREFQQAGTARLLRAQQTAQATIDSFPDPVIVVDPNGAVERANPAARRILGVIPTDGTIPWASPSPLKPALDDIGVAVFSMS